MGSKKKMSEMFQGLKTTKACFSIDEYFNSTPCKLELKKEIGASIFCSFCCVKIVAYDVLDEKVYNTNRFEKVRAC